MILPLFHPTHLGRQFKVIFNCPGFKVAFFFTWQNFHCGYDQWSPADRFTMEWPSAQLLLATMNCCQNIFSVSSLGIAFCGYFNLGRRKDQYHLGSQCQDPSFPWNTTLLITDPTYQSTPSLLHTCYLPAGLILKRTYYSLGKISFLFKK